MWTHENLYLKHLSEGLFFQAFPRAQKALFFVSPLNSFQGGVEGQHLIVVMI